MVKEGSPCLLLYHEPRVFANHPAHRPRLLVSNQSGRLLFWQIGCIIDGMKNADKLFERAVLIVDDEATNRAMLANILEGEYKIFQAADGREALDIIRDKNNGVSLVLLDLLMPNMSGFDVLRQMKEEGISAELPIIVLTSEKSSEIESLKLGAADFLTKPYDLPEVILARVRHAIELFENSKIIRATEYDKLTGLFTPEFFFEFAERLDERSPQKAMDALVIDLARFHLLNQLNGRDFGDKVLKAMADGIRAALQKHGGIAARYGADVFYVYSSCGKDYSAFLKEIDAALSSLLKSTEKRVRVGAFLDEKSALPLVERFDRALHACNSLRSKSGEELCVYDQSMAEKALFDARLLKDFESAIEQKQFKVNYQPKFDIRGEKPVLRSAEALVCWIHPELGRVRPDLFIPLFEENGLVTILDRYVWEESAKQIKKWKDEFGVTLPVSVNVSRVDMAAPDMTSFIQKIVKENGLSPADYMLEITESAYTDDTSHIIEVVENLRALGHKVEMDDFGSGYSSLNMLTSMPIDALKMDKAFIRNIKPGNKDMKLVELVLEIAKSLEVPVVAEGVETEEEYKMLKEAGCDIIQGYYFSKPIPPEEFKKYWGAA